MGEQPTAENGDYPLRGTCDVCAEGGVPIRLYVADDGNAPYICQECDARHQRALQAAHDAAWGELPSWAQEGFGSYDEPTGRWLDIVAAVVKGYLEFTDDADIGGPT